MHMPTHDKSLSHKFCTKTYTLVYSYSVHWFVVQSHKTVPVSLGLRCADLLVGGPIQSRTKNGLSRKKRTLHVQSATEHG